MERLTSFRIIPLIAIVLLALTPAAGAADAPPEISGFTPPSGAPGTQVTISGQGFEDATQVRFNDADALFVANSDSRITAQVPTDASTGPISVTSPTGTGRSDEDFIVTGATPKITSFAPKQGPVGTQVTINGVNLNSVTSVQFNGAEAPFANNSSTQVIATVPPNASTGPIRVATTAGSDTSDDVFTVSGAGAPVISNFSPKSGPVGTNVTITGSNFTGTTSVRFNNTEAPFVQNTSGNITATVPPGASTGPIRVQTPAGVALSAESFTVTSQAAPFISGFSPQSGPAGTQVTITGTNFTGTTSVKFNGVSSAFVFQSAQQLTATVPPTATTGPISVTTTTGTSSSIEPFTVTANRQPSISSISPTKGPVGTEVVVRGANFDGTTSVKFGDDQATYDVESSTRIVTIVPQGTDGGRIFITTPQGQASSSVRFQVTEEQPLVSSFSPTSGPPGTNVQIEGQGFENTTSVSFNGTAAPFTVFSDSQIAATVPPSATTGPIEVSTTTADAFSSSNFVVTEPTVSHDRGITLVLNKHLVAKGQVTTFDGFADCSSNVAVTVQRRSHRRWSGVQTVISDGNGVYKVLLPDREGLYRARVKAQSMGDSGENRCLRATSTQVRHSHRR